MPRWTTAPAAAAALAVAVLGAGAPAPAPAEVPLAALFDPGLQPRLSAPAWSPAGGALAGPWREGERKGLKVFDAATGGELWTVFADELAEAGSAAGAPIGSALATSAAPPPPLPSVDAFSFRPASSDLLLTAGGDLFLWTPGTPTARRLTRSEAKEEGAEFSPDGRRIAFSRAADLWLLELASGRETRLTDDGREDEILNGKTDWVYWEEIWSRRFAGIWWAPDSRSLAYYRFDLRQVPAHPLLEERDATASVRWQKYPRPGEANAAVSVRVVDLADPRPRTLATGADPETYLARVAWRPDGGAIAVQRLNRDQTRLDLLLCDPATTICAEVAAQSAATWVNLTDDFRFLPDGGFVWSDESSGWRDLARYDRGGRARADLLPEPWVLDSVDGLLGGAREVVATVWRRDRPLGACGRQVLALPLDGGTARVLAEGPGWNSARVAPAGDRWLHEWSDAAHPTVRTLRDGGAPAAALPGGVELPAELAALPSWSFLELAGPEGVTLPARWIPPAGATSGSRHPVITYHYGGPGSQVVVDRWEGGRGLWHRWMAARGYGVFMIDNEASLAFGKRGEDRIHRRMGELELAGQLAGVAALGSQSWADVGRLGLWGWSGGGFNTLYSILNQPGVWTAAVAGAPVTDWRAYDSVWTERYLDTPESNPDGYRDSSPVSVASALADALLVVHGTADDNVHPGNSTALVELLVKAGKRFDSAFYPGQKHGFEPDANRHFYERMTEFFDRHLRPVP
jgi:dipeptidyl-peptidase-4